MTQPIQQQRGLRWWPVWIIAALALAGLAALWLNGELMRQLKFMGSYAIGILVFLALIFWAVALSRLPWKRRLGALSAAILVIAFLVLFVRVRGVTGDWIPILAWSWSEPPSISKDVETFGRVIGDEYSKYSFPQFAGANRDSRVADVDLAPDFDASPPKLIWKRQVGTAWTGFAVTAGFAITLEQRDDQETVAAYALDSGQAMWSHSYPARFDTNAWVGGVGPRSTPTVDDGWVFSYGATGVLTAIDVSDGSLVWSRDVTEENQGKVPEWGVTCSPLVFEGRVIVTTGNQQGRALVAYDRLTGEPVWTAGSDSASYSSPFISTVAGEQQIIVLNGSNLVGHRPQDGSVLWQQPWPSGGSPTVAQPLPLGDDRLLVSAGYGVGAKLFEVNRTADGTFSTETLWESIRLKAKFTQMVQVGATVYGLDDGILTALDPTTGERLWKGGRYGHGQMLLVGGLLLISTEDGDVVLVEPDPQEHRELSRFEALPGKLWNPPALAGPYLVLRNDEEAVCYKLETR